MTVCMSARANTHLPKHTGPSYKPYCMPSLTVALLLLEWLHDGVYAGRSVGSCDTGSSRRARTDTPTTTTYFWI